jgi:putative transcriptional regulator
LILLWRRCVCHIWCLAFSTGKILKGKLKPARTFVVEGLDIKRIRALHQLSQEQFAALMGISVGTLRNWEQGRRKPEGPARVLLQVAAKHPEVLWDAIQPVPKRASRKGRQVQNV